MPDYIIKLRRDVAANWTSVNPVLAEGELGYETDTKFFKVGDGLTHWEDLEYTVDEDQYLPDATGIPDGKLLTTLDEGWAIVDPPTTGDGLPDATGVPDGKMLATLDESWVIVDPPSGGGTPSTGGRFRGTWGNEYLAWADDFSDDSIDSPWVKSGDAGGTGVILSVDAGASMGTTPSYTKTAYVHGGMTVGVFAKIALDLSLLDIPNITRIKFFSGTYNGSNGNEVVRTIRKNGVDTPAYPTVSQIMWGEYNLVADSNDVFEWICYNDEFGVITTANGNLYVTGVRVYATTEPYMFNDVVAYGGSFYRSITDNNVTTPGVDASWELVTGTTTPGGMVYLGAYVAGQGGSKGHVVDYDGFMWLCLNDTADDPVTIGTYAPAVASLTKGGDAANDGTTPAYVNLTPAVNAKKGSIDGATTYTTLDGMEISAQLSSSPASGADGFFLGFTDTTTVAPGSIGTDAGGMGTNQLAAVGFTIATYSGGTSRAVVASVNTNWTGVGPSAGQLLNNAVATFKVKFICTDVATRTYTIQLYKDGIQQLEATGVVIPDGPYRPRVSAATGGINCVHQVRTLSAVSRVADNDWRKMQAI